jgi:hypothetical protein
MSRSASPDFELVPDRMAERIVGGEVWKGRLTPKIEEKGNERVAVGGV